MKELIVLSGVSGTGKTRWRTEHPDFKNIPYVDIADIYKSIPNIPRGAAVVCAMWIRIASKLETHDTVIAEGYFLRESESRAVLLSMARLAGVKVRIINFWAPLEECERRIRLQQLDDEDTNLRIDMLKRCWREKGE